MSIVLYAGRAASRKTGRNATTNYGRQPRAADPRFGTARHLAEAAWVRTKLGQKPQDWNVDPRFV